MVTEGQKVYMLYGAKRDRLSNPHWVRKVFKNGRFKTSQNSNIWYVEEGTNIARLWNQPNVGWTTVLWLGDAQVSEL